MTDNQPIKSRAELYHVEAGTLRAHGSVTDRGESRSTVLVHFTDTATTNDTKVVFSTINRQTLADLLRGIADNIAPQADGMPYTFWCELHRAELEGQPHMCHDPIIGAWVLTFEHLECTHDPDGACRPGWVVGRVAVPQPGAVA